MRLARFLGFLTSGEDPEVAGATERVRRANAELAARRADGHGGPVPVIYAGESGLDWADERLPEALARMAYALADAMLHRRALPPVPARDPEF